MTFESRYGIDVKQLQSQTTNDDGQDRKNDGGQKTPADRSMAPLKSQSARCKAGQPKTRRNSEYQIEGHNVVILFHLTPIFTYTCSHKV